MDKFCLRRGIHGDSKDECWELSLLVLGAKGPALAFVPVPLLQRSLCTL